jgi:GxxExxY protein
VEFDHYSNVVIGCAIKVHKALGPGLLESAYEACLAYELAKAGVPFARQVPLLVRYDGVEIDCAYRLDLVIDGTLIVELKAVNQLLPIHEAQILSYLRLSGMKVGILLNFHTIRLNDGGLRRLVNRYEPS